MPVRLQILIRSEKAMLASTSCLIRPPSITPGNCGARRKWSMWRAEARGSCGKLRHGATTMVAGSGGGGTAGVEAVERLYLGMDFGTYGASFALIDINKE